MVRASSQGAGFGRLLVNIKFANLTKIPSLDGGGFVDSPDAFKFKTAAFF